MYVFLVCISRVLTRLIEERSDINAVRQTDMVELVPEPVTCVLSNDTTEQRHYIHQSLLFSKDYVLCDNRQQIVCICFFS